MNRKQALADYLEVDISEIEDCTYDEYCFQHVSGGDYLVLTDKEADERAYEEMRETVWTFNTDFIISHSVLTEVNDNVVNALKKMQGELCEDANEFILKIIEDFDEFVEDAIYYDGRGHFLSFYDGSEEEQNGFFIYRVD